MKEGGGGDRTKGGDGERENKMREAGRGGEVKTGETDVERREGLTEREKERNEEGGH